MLFKKKNHNNLYMRLAAIAWSASVVLCIISFWMGKHVILSHTIIPPPDTTTYLIAEPPKSPPKIHVNCVISKSHASTQVPSLRDYIKSFNTITNEKTISSIIAAINDASKQFELPKEVLVGLVATESSFDPKAVSSKKCVGLTQINVAVWYSTLKEEGIVKNKKELLHPAKNIKAGAHILRFYLDEGKRKGVKTPMLYALNHYNGTNDGTYFMHVKEKMEEFGSNG